MTNMQFIALLTPALGSLVLVLLAWLHQNQRLSDFRDDVSRRFDQTDARIGRIETRLVGIEQDQKQFFTVTGKLDGRIEELSRR